MCTNRDLQTLSKIFRTFADHEATELESPMYAELANTVSSSSELLEIASHCSKMQPAPNLLFASVQFLLISGLEHPLRQYFPLPRQYKEENGRVSRVFREFCLRHREAIVDLMQTRSVQSNVVNRCSCLLPAFSKISQLVENTPLYLIDLGASAGLNLNFHSYSYTYTRAGKTVLTWGKQGSNVHIHADLRGRYLPPLNTDIAVGGRVGIDLRPIDVQNKDSVNWLRSLVWPEHIDHHRRLIAAIEEFKRLSSPILEGDAIEQLPKAIESAPENQAITIYSTISAYQFSESTRNALDPVISGLSLSQPIWFLTLENDGAGQYELLLMRYRCGRKVARKRLAKTSPHGLWLEWLKH